VRPLARRPILPTVIRSPWMHGFPPITSGSCVVFLVSPVLTNGRRLSRRTPVVCESFTSSMLRCDTAKTLEGVE
jgi:hypothetical protein